MQTKTAGVERVLAALRDQLEVSTAHEGGVRAGRDPEDIHEMRVAVRRMRTILRASRPMFERKWTEGLRDELEWLGTALGHVRDLDVLLASLQSRIKRLPASERRIGAVLLGDLEADAVKARRTLRTALAGPRYRRLLRRLDLALRHPHVVTPDLSLLDVAAREFEKVRSAVKDLPKRPRDEDLHAIRIKLKRARYAAELVRETTGRPGERFLDQAKALQDLLGDHQDSVVLEERLRGTAGRTAELRAVTKTLIKLERKRRKETRAVFPDEWRKLKRRGRKVWA
jgi:CHAD domain-containing protein